MTRQSDDAIERLLRRGLRTNAATAEPCPEAEALAAFVDGSLGASEVPPLEAHVASCRRCAQMLALLVDSAPAPAAADAAAAPWWSWRGYRWAVPTATAVLVAGIWFASTLQRPRSSESSQPASKVESMQEAAQMADATADPTSAEPTSAPAADDVDSPARRRDVTRQEKAAPAFTTEVQEQRAEASVRAEADLARRAEVSPPQVAAPRQRAPAATTAEGMPKSENAPPSSAAAARAADGASSAAAAADTSGAQSAASGRQQDRLSFAAPPLLLRSGVSATQWRVLGTTIERSTDGGTRWQREYQAPGVILSGAVASDDTVWLGGRGGLVIRRSGAGWAAVASPGTADVMSVTDVTATGATVILADGRALLTSDGGRTWSPR